jgi:hypothetical protein
MHLQENVKVPITKTCAGDFLVCRRHRKVRANGHRQHMASAVMASQHR